MWRGAVVPMGVPLARCAGCACGAAFVNCLRAGLNPVMLGKLQESLCKAMGQHKRQTANVDVTAG